MRRFLKNWLPVLIWLGVIFLGSADLMSVEHTSRCIVPFLRWLKPDLSPEALVAIHSMVRKCAHISEYAVLALPLFRAAHYTTNLKRSMPIVYVSVWVGCFLVATTDEFHQAFVASRGASARDVMIGGTGAILGLLIGVFLRRCSTKLGKTTAGL
jgi:VanZ family protein